MCIDFAVLFLSLARQQSRALREIVRLLAKTHDPGDIVYLYIPLCTTDTLVFGRGSHNPNYARCLPIIFHINARPLILQANAKRLQTAVRLVGCTYKQVLSPHVHTLSRFASRAMELARKRLLLLL